MTRLHADPVEVRTCTAPTGPVPEQFLWRGRLYLVLEVLASWTEAGGWWRGGAVGALTSGEDNRSVVLRAARSETAPQTAPIPASPKWGQRAWGEPAPDVGAGVGPAGVDDREQQWWRVEAASGRAAALSSAGPGVYDLCFAWSSSSWSLTRVLD